MNTGFKQVVRYSRAWSKGTDAVQEVETTYTKDGEEIPGTLFMPLNAEASQSLPGWVVLHGVTVPGRKHASLVRFARALAATQAVVFTPEIPAWTALRLDPLLTVPTIEAAVLALAKRPEADPSRTGLLGFSFGSPQAIAASTQPSLQGVLKAVVGFGGYSDLGRTLRYLFTGHHEWEGQERYSRPDPYGRWIVGANFLQHVEGFESAEPLSDTLHTLASKAGLRQIASWDPSYDGYKAELRASLPKNLAETFDLFAPPAAETPNFEQAASLAALLHRAIQRISPELEPANWVNAVSRPVHLIHGRDDPLIPFTETRRLASLLRATQPAGNVFDTVTPLFAHSSEHDGMGVLSRAWESVALARALARILASV